jgi:hypothetical protein
MREKNVESYLRKRVEEFGGRSKKWVSPGNNGVPDRIVFLFGHVFFIETKRPGVTKLRTAQNVQRRDLEKQGQFVNVLNTKELVDEWIDAQSRALSPKRSSESIIFSNADLTNLVRLLTTEPRKNAMICNIKVPCED